MLSDLGSKDSAVPLRSTSLAKWLAPIKLRSLKPRKKPPYQDLSVDLYRHREDKVIRIRIERIRLAGHRIEPRDAVAGLTANAVLSVERAAGQDHAVSLHDEAKDRVVGVGIERVGRSGCGVETGNAVADLSAHIRETATARIWPSACNAIERNEPFAFGSKENVGGCHQH